MLMRGGAASAEFHFHPLSIDLTSIWLRNPLQKHLGLEVARPLALGIQPFAAAAKSLQSCLTLCNSIDGIPPGSPIPGILQARTLEWVAISFSNTAP